ncbi:MAG TPA: hypothetical protein VNQ79_18255 [Blastocatellia bacterium]|nr:hypothetical protein [Blastocatellia bacterium]
MKQTSEARAACQEAFSILHFPFSIILQGVISRRTARCKKWRMENGEWRMSLARSASETADPHCTEWQTITWENQAGKVRLRQKSATNEHESGLSELTPQLAC